MKLPRRQFLHLAAGAAAVPVISRAARAQTYPTRPVRLVVGSAAGGPNDILARILAQWLTEHLNQQFIVENRTGAGGNVATEAVVNAPPDGYTLLMANTSHAINATLYDKLNYVFIRDTQPVAALARMPLVMEVIPSIPAKNVPEFIAYAKANPDKINMASGGNGTSVHVAGELFKMMTGVSMLHVPYRGEAPAITDLLGGQVQVMFGTAPPAIEHIRSGKLRALAVTTTSRAELLPDVPTIGNFVPGYEASAWFGICAPRNAPTGVVDRLNLEINAGLADPKLKARFVDLSATVLPGSPADFGKLIAEETEKWGKVVKFSGAKAD